MVVHYDLEPPARPDPRTEVVDFVRGSAATDDRRLGHGREDGVSLLREVAVLDEDVQPPLRGEDSR